MKTLIARHKAGEHIGICSVCSAHPLVIEAALAFDRNSTRKVLIEATSNQVNQFGGYTGMTPADFREFVFTIADKVGFARERIILGGDHLGPNCWQQENADAAMEKSVELVKEYVRAGFSKIHLDASMSCAGDPIPLAPETVAERAAVLCFAAESVATDCQREQLSYVIGTEVPVPGGEASAIQSVHITHVEDAANTLRTHQKAFIARGLTEALTRVIAIVVQPGVEFDHSNIIHYQPQEAQALAQWIENTRMVYEAHSTDYQTRTAYWELVRDHFAILKVGPALTFALREAIFALAQIEQESGKEFIHMEMGVPGLEPSKIGVKAEHEALDMGLARIYPNIEGIPFAKTEISRFAKLFMDIDVSPACSPVNSAVSAAAVDSETSVDSAT